MRLQYLTPVIPGRMALIISAEHIDQLMLPIEEARFAGCYLKLEGDNYRSLRNDFNQAQTSMRALTESSLISESLIETNLKNWETLSDHLFTCLTTQTKDVELLGWLITSQVVLDPTLEGFENTLITLDRWASEHFEALQPCIPDDRLKTEGSDEQAIERTNFKFKSLLPLLGDSDGSGLLYMPLQLVSLIGDITFYRYTSAEVHREMDTLRQIVNRSLAAEYDHLCAKLLTLGRISDTLKQLDHTFSEKASHQPNSAPNFVFLKRHVERMITAMEQISGVTLEHLRPPPSEDLATDTEVNHVNSDDNETAQGKNMSNLSNEQQQPLSGTGVEAHNGYTRESAYRELRHIANFFKRTEPHSPVAYLLDKAIRWGAMPLNELLSELLKDQPDTRESIFKLTGLNDARPLPPVSAPPAAVPATNTEPHQIHTPQPETYNTQSNAVEVAEPPVSKPPEPAQPNSNGSQLW
ncbi:Uncharacterised protein [BD1-7 clade bacterium]|uniref:ImpA N-terminal domain-containing protein n=1 Tax=BD1-7 clade bacterium TaxID=2029982 RepID=A0A5S9N510_9GAMM|nr:Uncharacterised protein [BD1-7 clade bacterium]